MFELTNSRSYHNFFLYFNGGKKLSDSNNEDPTEPKNLDSKDLIKIMSEASKEEQFIKEQKDQNGSEANKNKKKKQKESQKTGKKPSKKMKGRKTTASVTFYYILAFSTIALAFGCLWAIGDFVWGPDKFEWFLGLSIGLQFVIIGVFGLFFLIMLITAMSMFRKGNRFVYNLLYPDIERAVVPKENFPAKIITAGLLISLFVITVGLVISLISSIFSVAPEQNFIEFLVSLTGGLRVILISVIILALTLLVICFVWVWENGYNSVLNKVIKYNKPQDGRTFGKHQIRVSTTVYIISMISIIALAFGTIWAILDAIQPTGKWEAFLNLALTWQITIIGALAAMLFGLIILGIIFFKRGRDSITRSIYKKTKAVESLNPNAGDKILTWSVLLFILLIIVGAAYYLVTILLENVQPGETTTLIEFLLTLPNGLLIIVLSSLVLGGTWLVVAGTKAAKSLHHSILKSTMKMRHKIGSAQEDEEEEQES